MKHPLRRTASCGLLAGLVALIVLSSLQIQYHHLKDDLGRGGFATENHGPWRRKAGAEGLPRGIVESQSDMYLRPLWDSAPKTKWSDKAIHIPAHNQTNWWFAKRFLHPNVVAIYNFIFLWDEDLGVENFDPRRYLDVMVSEGLEITQPALDPDLSTDIHHRITICNKMTKVHRRIYDNRASMNCSDESKGPPCTGWVEGMAPVFSRAAWRCVCHLIQNDLIHGWGLDMKLGYCAQVLKIQIP